jgi:hypothetical protein
MATAPLSNLTATWNASGTTFTGLKLDVTDTASAAGSLLMDLQVGGASRVSVTKGGRINAAEIFVNAAGRSLWMSDGGFVQWGSNQDLQLHRDAADTLAQRRGTNAQKFNIYNTYTDASNYERGFMRWEGSVLQIGTGKAGTGGARELQLVTDFTARWRVDVNGHLLANTDNAVDIGANGATRPRTLYLGTSLNLGGTPTIQAVNGTVYIVAATETPSGSSSYIKSTNAAAQLALGTSNADSVVISGGNTPLVRFGGTTSSFPSLKRNATALEARLADDSAFAPFNASAITLNQNTAAAPAISGLTPVTYSVAANAAINDAVYLAAANATRIVFVRVNTTLASPSTMAVNDAFGQINGGGYNGTSYVTNAARIQLRANEAWTASASGTRVEIITTPNTTNSPANVATFYGGGVHIGNTPTDPGTGAISAQGSIRAASLTAIPAGGSTATGLTSTSTSNFGVFFGSGAPTLSAAKGSLYLRSDGTTTNDRAYINTNGSTTWTALTTAA